MALNAPTDQTYTMGRPITALTLPVATGGTGTLTYTLTGPAMRGLADQAVPGLTFTATTRVLSGTPTTASDHGPDLHRHRPERQHRHGYL